MARHGHADSDAHNCVQSDHALLRQANQPHQQVSVRGRKIGKPFFPEARREFSGATAQNRKGELQIRRKHEQAESRQRPVECFTGKKQPATHENRKHRNFGEAAA